MTNKNNNYCVILAGGKGRRLWPCSRENKPKQFLDFFGTGRTQLQQTFDRFMKILPKENIYINTNVEYTNQVKEQLPEIDDDNIMSEPIFRNTAPSVSWAVHRILRKNKEANIIVTPSDQIIFNEDNFINKVNEGFEFVNKNDGILTIGIKPTRPEPGYGYIQIGDQTDVNGIFKVQSFTEKPEREFAKMFLNSGEFYWNTGLFMANALFLRECFYKILPAVFSSFDEVNPNATIQEENDFIDKNFPLYPNLSIDYGILEKSEKVYVMKCDFGWVDVGTWHSIYEAMKKREGDNVVINSDVIMEDSRDNVIKLPEGKTAVINGLEGYIVAEKDNVLLICKKEDSSALIRKYINEIQMKKGNDFI